MFDIKTITGAFSVAGVAIGFLYREYNKKQREQDKHMGLLDTGLHNVEDRTLVIETKQLMDAPKLEAVITMTQAQGIQLAAHEQHVSQIRADVQEIKSAIHNKLDEIPRLTEALDNFRETCKGFMPRSEAEGQIRSTNERVDYLQERVDKTQK